MVEDTVWVPLGAEFSFSGDLAKATRWTGLIFRAGVYAERGLTFTAADLEGMVRRFPAEGVPVKSEHEDTLWDLAFAKHGARLVRIWTENEGAELHGEFRTPGWLDAAFEGIRKTVSVGLTQTFDAIREISLVLNPRVADACVHKLAASFRDSPDFQTFAAQHPREAAQIVNVAHRGPYPVAPMDKQNIFQRARQALFGLPSHQRGGLTDEELNAAFSEPSGSSTGSARGMDPSIRSEIDRMKADVERDRQEFAQERAEKRDQDDAGRFFIDELKAGRVSPSDEADVLTDFANARFRDRFGSANFNADAPGEAEKALRERYAKRPFQFRLGPGVIDSTRQPRIDSGNELGIFANDFNKPEDK